MFVQRIVPVLHIPHIVGLGRQHYGCEPRFFEQHLGFFDQNRAGHAADESSGHVPDSVGKRFQQRKVGNGHLAPGFQYTVYFPPNLRFVRGKVDHAVGKYHVNAVVRYGKAFNFAKTKLHIVQASALAVLPNIFSSFGKHLRRHVHTDNPARCLHLFASLKHVKAASAAKVHNGLSFPQRGDGNGVTAGKPHIRAIRQLG